MNARALRHAIVSLAIACTPSANKPVAPQTSTTEVHFTAVVRLPEQDTFRGVFLDARDGIAWVASYERDALWRSFDGQTVDVVGEKFTPPNQALVNPHVHVRLLTVVDPKPGVEFVRMSGDIVLEGHLESDTWPERTKLAGEKRTRFITKDGRAMFLANEVDAAIGKDLEVRGRMVEPSPFVARPGGDYVWITDAISH
jgi:hypothetical protein